MEYNKIGEYIKEKRKAKELTQKELGDLLSVTDKAVSKWERNISLPDIAILNKLAEVLNTTVSNILNGHDGSSEVINIDKEITKIKNEINLKQTKEKKKYMIIIAIFILTIILLILGNISFGYYHKKVNYSHFYKPRNITIGIPKTSFMMKYHDKSYSFKNFRNKNILEKEIKDYLKTLDYLTCNDTIYYYSSKDNFSITNYSVENHILYNTITYTITDNDFCYMKKVNEYSKKLGTIKRIHSFNKDNNLNILFIDGYSINQDIIYEFKAKLKIEYNKTVLEESIGDIEIKDNKLYYYRTDIINKANDINIPEVSVFKLNNGNMILIDNYLINYYNDDIILK